jgi:tetratricopeptide (TPR) repeat protein
VLFHLNEFEAATICLKEGIKLNPDAGYPVCYQGYIAIINNNIDLAENYFHAVLKRDATSPGALLGKGLVALLQKKERVAQQLFQQAQESQCNLPMKLEFYYTHGKVLAKFGFIDEAQLIFQTALQLKSDYIPVLKEMENLTLSLNETSKEDEELQQAIALSLSVEDNSSGEKENITSDPQSVLSSTTTFFKPANDDKQNKDSDLEIQLSYESKEEKSTLEAQTDHVKTVKKQHG